MACKTEITSEQRKEWGRLGGLTTAAKHGPSYMAEIGSRGFSSFAQKYCGGNHAAARRMLKLSGQRKLFYSTPWEWSDWLSQREGSNKK